MTRRLASPAVVGWAIVAVCALLYWLIDRRFDAYRGDFFYLAEAFLEGRTWLDFRPGPYDLIQIGDRYYVPFAPFPAIALMPIVAVVGAMTADQLESGINAILAASGVGLCWMLLGRIGVPRQVDRVRLVILFGFSTQILWVTARGGVWHTGHLVATILTFACLIEIWGRQRAWLIGLLAGFAFLTRAPLAFAIPAYALLLDRASIVEDARAVAGSYIRRTARIPWRAWAQLTAGVLPSIAFFFLYNQLRFGTPLESGYALALIPPFLEDLRLKGLFSIEHVPMNLYFLFAYLPSITTEFPFLRPDGLSLSIFITSPGLCFAALADWRRTRPWLLLLAVVAVLLPTLFYYGGGWFQYGYRYFLDSVPFVMALCGLAAVHQRRIATGWTALIWFGVVIMGIGVYWSYNLH